MLINSGHIYRILVEQREAEHLPPQLEASRLDCGGACEKAKERIKASALGALAVDAG